MTRPVGERTVLVTGATDGLGRATARELAERGASLLVHGRSARRVEETVTELRELAGDADRAAGFVADLSSLAEVSRLAEEVAQRAERLDTLVNNAGLIVERRETSADGYELTLAVNYLSHFLLTDRLLDLLGRSGPSRVVNVASVGQRPIDFSDPMLERGYDGFTAYAQSKLAQISFTLELAERLRAADTTGVTVNALHPATLMDTKMVRQSFGRARASVAEGVEATVRLAVGDDVEGVCGRYFDGMGESTAHRQAYDAQARRRLWDLSEEWITAALG